MKTRRDPRHKRRRILIKALFSQSFSLQKTKDPGVGNILKNLPKIDSIITEIAPEFPTDKINKTDLAILRLAVYELSIEKKEPPKVVVDEAVELGKEYGGDTSPAFINGALGNLVKKIT